MIRMLPAAAILVVFISQPFQAAAGIITSRPETYTYNHRPSSPSHRAVLPIRPPDLPRRRPVRR
eukprot:scaffold315847_cov15-Prasinocladus_malaysianus.AAC.1